MEKKIEENTPCTHPKHECDDIRTKTFFNSEKYTGTKCGICDTILEFNWKVAPSLPTGIEEIFDDLHHELITEKQAKELVIKAITTPSLPTDEEIESKLMQSAMTRTDDEFGLDKLEIGFHDTIIKWLRTNFSSEKWISVEDRLPEAGQEVFCYAGEGHEPYYTYYTSGLKFKQHTTDDRVCSHWKPFNPPKQNGK